jgi:hypothetical protein
MTAWTSSWRSSSSSSCRPFIRNSARRVTTIGASEPLPSVSVVNAEPSNGASFSASAGRASTTSMRIRSARFGSRRSFDFTFASAAVRAAGRSRSSCCIRGSEAYFPE